MNFLKFDWIVHRRVFKLSGGAPFSTCALIYKLQKVIPVSFVLPSRYQLDTIALVQKHICLACHVQTNVWSGITKYSSLDLNTE